MKPAKTSVVSISPNFNPNISMLTRLLRNTSPTTQIILFIIFTIQKASTLTDFASSSMRVKLFSTSMILGGEGTSH